MIREQELEQIVREVIRSLGDQVTSPVPVAPVPRAGLDPARDYPLASKRPDLVKTARGQSLGDITVEKALSGEVAAADLKITPEVLEYQAQIAESSGRPQLAKNMRRAAELTRIPDQRILEIYNALRPYRSSRAELLAIADELQQQHGAKLCAAFVREACEVHGRRKRLKES